jgi:hypothetical protein
MPPIETQPGTLSYAAGVVGVLSGRAWKALLAVGAAHFAAMLVLLAFSSPGVMSLARFIHAGPSYDWFIMGVVGHTVAVPVMALLNGLAVRGYWEGHRGRSPRRWFQTYVPAQLALITTQYCTIIVLAMLSPHRIATGSEIGVSFVAVLATPFAYAVTCLPLTLLAFRRIRRACFAG